MTRIVTLLTPGFADWETALLNAVAHSFYQVETRFATPGADPVTSSGGMRVVPDLAMEEIRMAEFDALVISGGSIWKSEAQPDLSPLIADARNYQKLIAGICDATVALARTGLLDDFDHTSNGAGYLDDSGYHGKSHYRDVPNAVRDRLVVTAPSTAPASFMAEVLRGLGLGDASLDFYVGMLGAEHAVDRAGHKAA